MISELIFLGLSDYESRAIESLSKQKFNLRDLSKKTKIPFGKVYSVVKSLKEKGFVRETNSRPKLIYMESVSDVFSNLISEKQKREKFVFENLRRIATEIDGEKGKETKFFQIGTTQDENKEIQMRTFDEAEEEVLQILNVHHKPKSNRQNKTVWEKAIVDATKRGVIFRSIYPESAVLPRILAELNKKSPEKFQTKKLDTDFTRCDIIDNKKVLIKLIQPDALNFGGVFFIENEKLAENLKRIFNEMWEHAN